MSSSPLTDCIVLCGPHGSGKTEIAKAWANRVDGQAVSFADPIRAEVARAIAINDRSVWEAGGINIERFNALYMKIIFAMNDPFIKDHYRVPLQDWGDWRTQNDLNYWLRPFDNMYALVRKAGIPLACGDVRLNNQRDLLKSWGFIFILLEPGPYVRDQGERVNHETEKYWPTWNYDYTLSFEEGIDHQVDRLMKLGLTGRHDDN